MPRLGPMVTDGGITFRLKYPEAKAVTIVGSFNNWDMKKNPLSRLDDGIWSITIPLREGRYEYLFLINQKKWTTDPYAPSADDGFGGKNSVIHIEK